AGRARELYEAKDHSVGVAHAEIVAGVRGTAPGPAVPATEAAAGDEPAILAQHPRFFELHAARDYHGIEQMHAPDFLSVHTRQFGWEEVHGIEPFMESVLSGIREAPDLRYPVRRVLARNARAIAVATAFVWGEQGAESALELGEVRLIDDAGRFTRAEFFPAD